MYFYTVLSFEISKYDKCMTVSCTLSTYKGHKIVDVNGRLSPRGTQTVLLPSTAPSRGCRQAFLFKTLCNDLNTVCSKYNNG